MPDTFGVPSSFTVNKDGSTTPPAAAGPGPACKLARITAASQVIPHATPGWFRVDMDTAIYDPTGMFVNLSSGTIKITKSGLYAVFGNLLLGQSASNLYTGLGIFRNTTDPDSSVTAPDGLKWKGTVLGSPNQYPTISVSGTLPCNAGDTLTLYIEADTASVTDITVQHFSSTTSNNSYQHRLEAALVG